jgi:UDP-N-acetyl-2-amino-2-deoxyglucuronate dehydrogenase
MDFALARGVIQKPAIPFARMTMENFGIIGVAGYIAPRHLRAIHSTGNRLRIAVDPHDSAGVLDQFFPDAEFFSDTESFFYSLYQRNRTGKEPVQYVTICSPNYLHASHIYLALKAKANVICEKPLVINPSDLDVLSDLEAETERYVYNIVQLRMSPVLIRLREELQREQHHRRANVNVTYVTRRGRWYNASWKGTRSKSGGLAVNIGVHLFDLMIWLFGEVQESIVHVSTPEKTAGSLELEHAHVNWLLSVDENDIPPGKRENGRFVVRSIMIEDKEIDFSDTSLDLHTEVYRKVLSGQGPRISDVRKSIELAYAISQRGVSV